MLLAENAQAASWRALAATALREAKLPRDEAGIALVGRVLQRLSSSFGDVPEPPFSFAASNVVPNPATTASHAAFVRSLEQLRLE